MFRRKTLIVNRSWS